MMKGEIVHINIPFFLSSVESLCDNSLKGKPFIIASSESIYSPILDISDTAYKIGIRQSMNVGEAKEIEKNIILIKPDYRKYTKALSIIRHILSKFTPIYELLPSSETYMDIKGTQRVFGTPEDLSLKVFREIYSQTGLKSHIGIGSNKLISKAAASFFSAEVITKVINGSEQIFLAPMSVKILPGIDKEILERLHDYNIFTIKDLTYFSQEYLCTIFGKFGNLLKLWSLGIDPRPIITRDFPSLQKEIPISHEENDYESLSKKIFSIASDIGFGLRERRLSAGRFKLTIIYIDNLTTSGYIGVKQKINTDISIYKLLHKLFYRIKTRRVNIKYITAEASLFSPIFAQQELIPLPQSREIRLFSAIDQIRKRFGNDSIRFGLEQKI